MHARGWRETKYIHCNHKKLKLCILMNFDFPWLD